MRTRPDPLPDHVTLPLLDRIMNQALDGAYADAARERAAREPVDGESVDGDRTDPGAHAEGRPRRRPRSGSLSTVAVVGVFGLLVAMSLVQQERLEPERVSGRSALIDQIQERRQRVANAQDLLGELRAISAGLAARDGVLEDDQREAEEAMAALGTTTGFTPVSGPGARITVGDSPSGLNSERVVDKDLAMLVDALWGAGAEAIAINGQRLTVQSAIRNSNWAIHVNNQPLRPPYVVEAVGDKLTLLANLADSPRGSSFYTLADYLHFEVDQQNVDELHLPAAPRRTLAYAVYGTGPADDSGDTGGSSDEPSEEPDPAESGDADSPSSGQNQEFPTGSPSSDGPDEPTDPASGETDGSDDAETPTDEPSAPSGPEETP